MNWYKIIKEHVESGNWNALQVLEAVKRNKITDEQAKEILGEERYERMAR